jgi:predicted nucleotidyltransferase
MLSALFTSKVIIELLSTFFLHQNMDFYVRELERITGEDYKNITLELRKLEAIGLLYSRKQGNLKYYGLEKDFLLYEELKSIFAKTRGAIPTLQKALSKEGGIHFAFIYGSLASGEETSKSDIDLMVIGEIPLEHLLKILREPERALARDINPSLYDFSEIRKRLEENDPFIRRVLDSRKILLVGDEGELRNIGQQGANKAV